MASFKVKYSFEFTFKSEDGNKRILKWRPFWNKVYGRHEANYKEGCVNPGDPLLITLQTPLAYKKLQVTNVFK